MGKCNQTELSGEPETERRQAGMQRRFTRAGRLLQASHCARIALVDFLRACDAHPGCSLAVAVLQNKLGPRYHCHRNHDSE